MHQYRLQPVDVIPMLVLYTWHMIWCICCLLGAHYAISPAHYNKWYTMPPHIVAISPYSPNMRPWVGRVDWWTIVVSTSTSTYHYVRRRWNRRRLICVCTRIYVGIRRNTMRPGTQKLCVPGRTTKKLDTRSKWVSFSCNGYLSFIRERHCE